METKHTPGPWKEAEGGWIDSRNGKSVIEYGGCGSHEADWPNPADKVLALAAPDMLGVLLRLYAHGYTTGSDHDMVRAVIAKATADANFGNDG